MTARKRRPIPDHIRWAVYARDGAACVFCGATGSLHLDHVTPWSAGGEDASWNLRPLCAACNLSRGVQDTDDDAVTRAPVGLSCTICHPSRPSTAWGYCLDCGQYGDVSRVDKCPDPIRCGCAERWAYARQARRRARRKRTVTR